MTDQMIPPVFRAALDEPAPPPPPEIEPEDDDDDRCDCADATLIVFGNGGCETYGLGGTLLLAWFCLGTTVTIGAVIWTALQWRAELWGFAVWLLAQTIVFALAGACLLSLVSAGERAIGWLRRRAARRVSVQP